MQNFRYQAMTQAGEIVRGTLAAPDLAEVARRIEYLGLVPVSAEPETAERARTAFFAATPRSQDITLFTRDLAVLLKAGVRLDEALELLLTDPENSRLQAPVAAIRAAVLAGESFSTALGRFPAMFPLSFQALVRVGEASGSLVPVLEALAAERATADALKQKIVDALRYPAFVVCAALAVLLFFLLFVLPQFGQVLHDFGAKLDPGISAFLALSGFMHDNARALGVAALAMAALLWSLWQMAATRAFLLRQCLRLPVIKPLAQNHRTARFCRNLGVLAGNGMALPEALRLLAGMMDATGEGVIWQAAAARLREGRKLAEALRETGQLPAIALRMLRLGEETGQLPATALLAAGIFEEKLQRGLERAVGIAGPAGIVFIALLVGSLIVSVMTSLLSINQLAA